MDYKELPQYVLLFTLIGMILGVGAIVFIAFGDSARITHTATDESHAFSTTEPGTALTQTEVRDFTSLTNTTTTLTENTDYNVTIGESATYVLVDAAFDGFTFNATYRYYSDSSTTTQLDNVQAAVGTISSTWLALIITILCLAVIMSLVMKGFGGAGR